MRSYAILDETLPKGARGRIEWRYQDCHRSGVAGHCMHLRYAFESASPAQVSFRIDLGDLDASGYDHVELWIKGDPGGFSPALKIGFRRPKPDLPRLMQDGTAVVTGISDRWQRIVVPLNRMAGISEWKHLRSFFLALESRRAGAARRGGYTIDDVTLLKLGGPGPTIVDEVVPRRKLAWQASVGGPVAAQHLAKQRLAGWPKRLLADRADAAARRPRVPRARRARHLARTRRAHRPRERPAGRPRAACRRSLEPPDSAGRRLHERHQRRASSRGRGRRLRARPHLRRADAIARLASCSTRSSGWRRTTASSSTTTTPPRSSAPATSSRSSTRRGSRRG